MKLRTLFALSGSLAMFVCLLASYLTGESIYALVGMLVLLTAIGSPCPDVKVGDFFKRK